MRKRPMFWISARADPVIVVVALFPGLFTHVPPNHDCQLANSNGGPTAGHPLGFTKQGCDVYSRIIHGTSTSLTVGLIVTVLVSRCSASSSARSRASTADGSTRVLSRIGDIFFSIPYILAAVVIMSVLLGSTGTCGSSRWRSASSRGRRRPASCASEILRVKNADYVMASTALGVSRFRILLRHVCRTRSPR